MIFDETVIFSGEGADELLYIDVVASLYGRSSIGDLVRRTAERVFIPLTVGGGVRTLHDVRTLLRAGADKVCINTAAVHSPQFIRDAVRVFGSQCISVAIEAIRQAQALLTWKTRSQAMCPPLP